MKIFFFTRQQSYIKCINRFDKCDSKVYHWYSSAIRFNITPNIDCSFVGWWTLSSRETKEIFVWLEISIIKRSKIKIQIHIQKPYKIHSWPSEIMLKWQTLSLFVNLFCFVINLYFCWLLYRSVVFKVNQRFDQKIIWPGTH